MRITTLLAASAALAGAAASTTSAATMSYVPNVVTYSAAGGEVNTPRIVVSGTQGGPIPSPYAGLVSDSVPVTAGPGCTAGPPLLCGNGVDTPRADVFLGDGNDDGYAGSLYGDTSVHGGPGNDVVTSSASEAHAFGDAGDDEVTASASGYEYGEGGAGDDKLRAYRYARLSGDAGNDLIATHTHGDTTWANGGSGSDRLIMIPPAAFNGGGTLSGGSGDDVLAIAPGGGAGSFDGDGGADVISVAYAFGRVDAGSGDDVVDAVDRDQEEPFADVIACGSGHDTVYADADDEVAADCEDVVIGVTPALPRVDAAIAAGVAFFNG